MPTDLILTMAVTDARASDLERVFLLHYPRIARTIARVVRDHARAEELAVDVFLKWSRRGPTPSDEAATLGWLLKTAVRMGLDELRRQARRGRYEHLLAAFRSVPATPEDVRAAREEQVRVRVVLAALRRRDAELLIWRSQDMTYAELAAILQINPTSVGTLLHRAQQRFKQKYEARYGRTEPI